MEKHTHEWKNGTVTSMNVYNGDTDYVTVTDVSERLANGQSSATYTIADALDLADDHEKFALTLRAAARRAFFG